MIMITAEQARARAKSHRDYCTKIAQEEVIPAMIVKIIEKIEKCSDKALTSVRINLATATTEERHREPVVIEIATDAVMKQLEANGFFVHKSNHFPWEILIDWEPASKD